MVMRKQSLVNWKNSPNMGLKSLTHGHGDYDLHQQNPHEKDIEQSQSFEASFEGYAPEEESLWYPDDQEHSRSDGSIWKCHHSNHLGKLRSPF